MLFYIVDYKYFAKGDDFMWLSYHVPCFYQNRGSICACFNKDFKAELLKDLEKEGVTYIKLETVKVKMGNDFVDEEILSFYTDDKNTHEKLQTFLDIFDDAVNKYESDLKQDCYFFEFDGCMLYVNCSDGITRKRSRILPVIKKLEEIWRAYPDMRLGQLLINCAGDKDLFNLEDDELMEALERFGDEND